MDPQRVGATHVGCCKLISRRRRPLRSVPCDGAQRMDNGGESRQSPEGGRRPASAQRPGQRVWGTAETLAVCCSMCCACGIVTLVIAYFIWGVITIVTSYDSTTTSCGAAHNIWAFCLSVVIVIPILGCMTSIIANVTSLPGLMAAPPVINLAMAIWGVLLWTKMGETCMMALEVSSTQPRHVVIFAHVHTPRAHA